MSDLDTGVAIIPATRPSTFTPSGYVSGTMLTRPTTAIDTGVATNPAAITNAFDDVTGTATVVDLGAV